MTAGRRSRLRASTFARVAALLLATLAVAGCGADPAPAATETVDRGKVVLDVVGEGQLQSAKATPLRVPGRGWSARQLTWMLPEGSFVEKGDLLARFSTERGELDLAEALIELERNELARAAKQGELASGQGRVAVDLSQVAVQLAIAERYANADLSVLARNEVLDAIQDADFLGDKQDTLRWQQGQSSERGGAELAVLDAQRATIDVEAERSRDDLDALELRAPHAGVMMLTANWTGDKPTIGSALRAGSEFGRLPDIGALEVELALPQVQAQGVKVGNAVELSPVGRPAQTIRSRIDWIASAAKVVSRDSPVKFVTMKAKVPSEAAREYGWVPGQRLHARVILFAGDQALDVANVAVRSEAGKHYVQVREGFGFERREVELGVRGDARSQVLKGLEPGDEVLLVAAETKAEAEAEAEAAEEAREPDPAEATPGLQPEEEPDADAATGAGTAAADKAATP